MSAFSPLLGAERTSVGRLSNEYTALVSTRTVSLVSVAGHLAADIADDVVESDACATQLSSVPLDLPQIALFTNEETITCCQSRNN
jgi:hypothetical protein